MTSDRPWDGQPCIPVGRPTREREGSGREDAVKMRLDLALQDKEHDVAETLLSRLETMLARSRATQGLVAGYQARIDLGRVDQSVRQVR